MKDEIGEMELEVDPGAGLKIVRRRRARVVLPEDEGPERARIKVVGDIRSNLILAVLEYYERCTLELVMKLGE